MRGPLSLALLARKAVDRSLASIVLAMRRAYPFGQFGQTNDTRTGGGASGCTETVLQLLALVAQGVWYTHDQIRAKVGHQGTMSGLTYGEVSAWLTAVRMPYRVELGLTADEIASLVQTRGPVLIGEQYIDQPEWLDFKYRGRVADGRRNGFAWPPKKAGRTQLNWDGRHAIGVLAIAPIPDWNGQLGVYLMEPNHGSSARPEQVPYDVVTIPQFRALVARYSSRNGKSYAAIPTRPITVAA